jgi:hypothetical protein
VTARLEEAGAAATPAPVQLFRETRQAAWVAARGAFAPRLAAVDWPATHADLESVLDLLSRAPFAVANPGSQRWRFRGARLAITWLADQPGGTWQQRWLASGAEAAGPGWKQDCASWLDAGGMRMRQRLDLLSVGMILAISADIVRPSLGWLAASGVSPWALARTLGHGRDPAGFARLRAAVGGPARSPPGRGMPPSAGPRSSWQPRAACLPT